MKKGVHTEMDLYSHGCLAFVDNVTGKLICSARFILLLSLDSVTFQEYDHVKWIYDCAISLALTLILAPDTQAVIGTRPPSIDSEQDP